jgi:hypothetical protein
VASSLGLDLTPIGVRDADEIKHGITELARRPNGGLIVVGPPSAVAPPNRDLIVRLAVQHRLPAIYASLGFVRSGGLIFRQRSEFEMHDLGEQLLPKGHKQRGKRKTTICAEHFEHCRPQK